MGFGYVEYPFNISAQFTPEYIRKFQIFLSWKMVFYSKIKLKL